MFQDTDSGQLEEVLVEAGSKNRIRYYIREETQRSYKAGAKRKSAAADFLCASLILSCVHNIVCCYLPFLHIDSQVINPMGILFGPKVRMMANSRVHLYYHLQLNLVWYHK